MAPFSTWCRNLEFVGIHPIFLPVFLDYLLPAMLHPISPPFAVTMNKSTDEANNLNDPPHSINEAAALPARESESGPKPDPWLLIRRWGERRTEVKSPS